MTAGLDVVFNQSTGMPKGTEQNLIVPNNKSEAEVANNKRLRSLVEAKYRHEASRSLFAIAELLDVTLTAALLCGLVNTSPLNCFPKRHAIQTNKTLLLLQSV